MKPNIRSLTAALFAFSLSFAAYRADAIDFSQKEMEKLQSGRTVKKPLASSRQNGFYGGTGWVLIDAPADVVWAALQDWNSYPMVYPRTNALKEISRKGDRALLRVEMGYKFLSIVYHLEVEKDAAKRMISFKMASNRPHDIDDTRGYWRLFPQKDGKTLVVYAVSVNVPMGVINLIGPTMEEKIERNLLGIPGKLKEWLESPSGARYRSLVSQR